jgi:hypothetical protein
MFAMRRSLILVVIAGLIPACGGAGVQSTEAATSDWAAQAVAWREGVYQAGQGSIVNALRFYDEDVVFEDRAGGQVIRGRDQVVDYAISVLGETDPSIPMRLLLSAGEALDQYNWIPVASIDWLDRVQVGRDGATLFVNALSIEAGRMYVPDVRDFDAIEALANRYVAFWNGTEERETRSLYTPEARIDDTLLGSSVVGLEAIENATGSGTWPDLPPMTVVTLPDDRGPAVYIAPSQVDPSLPDEVRILLDLDDGSGCPGTLGVTLASDQERVLWERRYHEVESVRRCLDPNQLQPGWWEDIEIPDPVPMELTGAMVWEERGITVEIYNGVSGTEGFVRWGFDRFAEAGLPLPGVAKVVFLPPGITKCRSFTGWYTPGESGATVELCFSPDVTWDNRSRATLLHEYAHPWIDEYLDEATQAEFLDLVDLPRWRDSQDSPDDRGVERAANAIMLGLIDDASGLAVARDISCEQSEEAFRLLTGTDPIAACES